MNKEEVREIVDRIRLPKHLMPDNRYEIHDKGDGFLLQLIFYAPDAATGSNMRVIQRCRKWYVSSHSTRTEVVETAYKAAKAGLEHELRECFTYNGSDIYNPHFSLGDRCAMADDVHLDIRIDGREYNERGSSLRIQKSA